MGESQESLGQRVRDARIARGWNQAQLAKVAGVAENTVSGLESGRRAAQPAKVAAILEALGLQHTPELDRGIPEDVRLVTDVVALWLTGIPAGEERAAAVLGLIRYLGTPAADPAAPVLDRTPGRGRGAAKDVRVQPASRDF